MFGLINLNKPAGFTSHDCIAKLRKLLNTRKIGHGGTLDPAATGVLPIAVGKATRLLQFLPEPKAYRACIRLGLTTTTDDLEGEVIESVDRVDLDSTLIVNSLDRFVGTIEQIPPIYSAIKKNGKKLYQLARKGEEVVVEPRTITITKIELINIDCSEFYELEVDIECSPGTYIRAIARDLGKMLGVGGTLASLIRTESCGMHLNNSITFDDIERQLAEKNFSLIEPSHILHHLGSATLTQESVKLWCQGQLVDLSEAIATDRISTLNEGDYIVVYGEDRTFLGISILFERNDILKIKPKIVCAS
ncbi:tRNA pseudouridine(55) synthase TruB [Waterburya agarophytonicola K14]|uniref:tRNA pseudouridine synthase B n=1 Tax=Waterburya agarophytonicola KI4 TaxID=2874699 RepID=A0A964BMI4_9CYAN|nr:tRNA pseudouridine(55) synthase TruB [Waterburya agarophytonicola]MCC0176088.1 tRNA pseudouridine(55) synthase TruB [Waterburya agarophytonicola KI4]